MPVSDLVERMAMAINRSIAHFGRSWGSPADQPTRTAWEARQAAYALRWGYLDGTAYDFLEDWARYKSDYGLVSDIRLLWSHVKRIVDFYYFHVYTGELSDDGNPLPGGQPLAIPLVSDNTRLKAAIAQLWQWWGWQDGMKLVVLNSAALADHFVELVDTPGKIMAEHVWPGYVKDVQLSVAGDITSYTKEYVAFDPEANNGNGETYVYRREIDKAQIRTFKDDEPQGFGGLPAVRDNPLGFVPVVMYRHWNTGGTWGEPAVWGSQVQLDALNNMLTLMVDYQQVILDSPLFVKGSNPPNTIKRQMEAYWEAQTGQPIDSQPVPATVMKIAQVSPDTELMTPQFDFTHARETVKGMIEAIESTHPEIHFWDEIRSMSTLTGPGARQATGDAHARLQTVSSNHDRQTRKLFQMAVAMAGLRLQDGSWASQGVITKAQEKFRGFGLDSYASGGLNFGIGQRDLIPLTEGERAALALQQTDLGLPIPWIWERYGIDQAMMERWIADGWIPPLAELAQGNLATTTTATAENDLTSLLAQPIATPETPAL